MTTYNIHEAKTHLSSILVEVEKGQEFLLARAGKVIARISPVQPLHPAPGKWKDRVWISPDFDKEDPGLVDLFNGSSGLQ